VERTGVSQKRFANISLFSVVVLSMIAVFLFLFVPLTIKAAESKASGQPQWNEMLKAAHKEGAVSIYFWQGGNLERVIQAFQKKYPDIQLSSVGGRGSTFISRITTEMRAGKYLVDVCICGVTSPYEVLHKQAKMLESIKSAFILSEVADESKWWQRKHHFQDPEGQFIFAYWGRAAATRVSYNTRLVNPSEFTSYWDLLNPKWKSKITAIEPTESAGGWRGLYYKPGVESEFLKRLFTEMDVIFSRNDRQATDWLATGKASLGLFLSVITETKNQGLPVDEFRDSSFKEPPSLDTGANGTIALMKQAPHPNAAKVFINWFLSKEGQSTYQEIMNTGQEYVESMREDIPKDSIPSDYRRRKGVRYVLMFTPDHMDAARVVKLFKETVKP
jgi:iron(III) transport system substrate-binding protein